MARELLLCLGYLQRHRGDLSPRGNVAYVQIHAGSAIHVGSLKAERIWSLAESVGCTGPKVKQGSRAARANGHAKKQIIYRMEIGFWKENICSGISQSRIFLGDNTYEFTAPCIRREDGRGNCSSYVIHFQVFFAFTNANSVPGWRI